MISVQNPTKQSDLFNGIFYELSNLGKADIVHILPSDTVCGLFKNVIFQNFKQHWFSFYPNPSLVFSFNGGSLALSSYSIQTYAGDINCGHMKSWIVEGSNDNKNWTVLSHISDTSALNSSKAMFNWEIPVEQQNPFQYIKIRMDGNNWAGSDIMAISRIEFFGKITLTEEIK